MRTNTLKKISTLLFPLILINQAIAEDQEALEIGGVVTLDYEAPADEFDSGDPVIGDVELTSLVNIDPKLRAAIKIKTDGSLDRLKVDKALGEYTPNDEITLTFGQQSIGHGLVSTHLISDPWIKDYGLDIDAPSFSFQYALPKFTPIVSVGYLKNANEEELAIVDDGNGNLSIESNEIESKGYYRTLIGFSTEPTEGVTIRTTSTFGKDRVDFVAGTEIGIDALTLDLEGYHVFNDTDDATVDGYYLGLSYTINDFVEVATRYDLLSLDEFETFDNKIGAGLNFTFGHGLFSSFEFSRTIPDQGDAVNTIALKFGLESSLKIPGFERKTLTNP